jgi:oligopeptide/dipeptide ABC transporter ATP-binding protein
VTAILEARGLRKLYPVERGRQLHAVDGVDLALEPGESLGIVGESGSGKSTLARLLARLVDLTAGEICFEGEPVGRIPAMRFGRHAARRSIQLVFQSAEDALNPALSIARNIAIGLGSVWLSNTVRMRVRDVAGEVGLPREFLDRRPHQLSGGQQARAGIARALIAEPRLLILDEPTAALDVSVQAMVLKLIAAVRRRRAMSLVFVSHDLEVVRLMCDRVLVLYLGRVAEIGPVEAVLGRPLHPYTQALMAASPGRGRPKPLEGEPLSPIDPPDACLFNTRCPRASHRCRSERPLPREIAGRLCACHHVEAA